MLFSAPESLDPYDIYQWRVLCAAGLDHEKRFVSNCLLNGTSVPPYLEKALPVGATGTEVDQYFMSCDEELELTGVLTLVAAAEARVRLDAARRSNDLDWLARRLKVLSGQGRQSWRVSLYDNGIMDAWKNYARSLTWPSNADRDRTINKIGYFKRVLTVRHWVAHGRYWDLAGGIERYPMSGVIREMTDFYDALKSVANLGQIKPFA